MVGLLCAHHQSWSSFGEEEPDATKIREIKEALVQTYSASHLSSSKLVDEISGIIDKTFKYDFDQVAQKTALVDYFGEQETDRSEKYNRMRLLLALLRVADGADVGRHRVPEDYGGKHTFLWRRMERRLLLAIQSVSPKTREKVNEVYKELQKGIDVRNSVKTGSAGWKKLKELSNNGSTDKRCIAALVDYAELLEEQIAYFNKHKMVWRVRFEESENYKDKDPIVVDAIVEMPPDWFDVKDAVHKVTRAVETVAEDIRTELKRPIGGQETVRTVLYGGGLMFSQARPAVRVPNFVPTSSTAL